jgi:hypothetical protein
MRYNILAIILFLIIGCSKDGGEPRPENPYDLYKEAYRGILGTYAAAPRLPDASINMTRLISELKDINANSYNWLVRNKKDDLEVLKKFLPMAREAGIKVWVTLVPPSEPPPSEPYKLDFQSWAVQLATLSLTETNLVAWSIDDFVHNLKTFTPEYTKKFLDDAAAINPEFAFLPCCYYGKINPFFVSLYGHLLNGILFPYRAESEGANLKNPSLVETEIADLRKMFEPGFPIVLDIYATAHSSLGATTPEYVNEALIDGMKSADGVLIYCHQDPVKQPEKYQIIKQGFADYDQYKPVN